MYLLTDLDQSVFKDPYKRGFRKLKILSGYASSPFLMHILEQYPGLEIELIIGMAKKDGLKRWDHERYKSIMNENPQISIKYQKELPGIHTKIYHWYNELTNDSVTFIGSANFSWNGFRDQSEILGEVSYPNIDNVFEVADTIDCNDPQVEEYISFYNVRVQRTKTQAQEDVQLGIEVVVGEQADTINFQQLQYVDLPLLIRNDTDIHERAGLNWGQREGREPNQAYIPVPTSFNRQHPDFFPPLEQAFTLLTDDGQQLVCKMAQQNRKAIHTTQNNSIMGIYFRKRLDVPSGTRVDAQDVINYGRTSVSIYKIDAETYFMDFGVTPPIVEV